MGSKPGSRVEYKSPCERWVKEGVMIRRAYLYALMLDIDYLGEENNPDGPPGLYDQAPRTVELPASAR
eukprot:2229055-Pleurochrysis_carterae.AAC.1